MTDWPDKDYASSDSVRKRKERIKKRRRARNHMANKSIAFVRKGEKENPTEFQQGN